MKFNRLKAIYLFLIILCFDILWSLYVHSRSHASSLEFFSALPGMAIWIPLITFQFVYSDVVFILLLISTITLLIAFIKKKYLYLFVLMISSWFGLGIYCLLASGMGY